MTATFKEPPDMGREMRQLTLVPEPSYSPDMLDAEELAYVTALRDEERRRKKSKKSK